MSRIIAYSITIGYFPTKISFVFLVYCFFDEDCVTKKDLLQCFKLYITPDERMALEKSLTNFDPDDDEMLDLLSSYNCYSSPTKESFEGIIYQLAHKEFIQKPKYVASCVYNT